MTAYMRSLPPVFQGKSTENRSTPPPNSQSGAAFFPSLYFPSKIRLRHACTFTGDGCRGRFPEIDVWMIRLKARPPNIASTVFNREFGTLRV